jgi:hypothetical protein
LCLSVFLAAASVSAAEKDKNTFDYSPKAMQLDLTDKTVVIKEYSVKYEGDFVKDLLGSKGIKHLLLLKNTSKQDIVAIQVGFVYFNYFNEPVGYTSTLVLDVLPKGEVKKVEAKGKFVGDATTYASFAFIHKVKFGDRSVQITDLESVKKKINTALGTNCGDEMFDDPETQSRRRFGVTNLVGFLI